MMREPVYAARRRFGPELVSLDTILCPEAPKVMHFRSLACLQRRVAGTGDLNLLALLQHPTAEEVAQIPPAGFDLAGFELLDGWGLWRLRSPEAMVAEAS
jgi:hypothetical protein